MRKKVKGEAKTCQSITLYESELLEILEVMKGCCGSVSITDDGFEYSNLEEVKANRGTKIKSLTIEGAEPALALRVRIQGKTELSHDGHILVLPAYIQIQQILKERRRPVLYALLNIYTALGAFCLFLLLAIKSPPPVKGVITIPVLCATALLVVLSVLSGLNHTGAFSQIILKSRHEEKSFSERNKDSIIVGIISSIIGAALAFVVAYLISKGRFN